MKSIKLDVTKADIEAAAGHEGEYHACPVARCLRRQGFGQLDVDTDRILGTKRNKRWLIEVPKLLAYFIEEFDDGKVVTPVSFDLDKVRLANAEDERKPLHGRKN